MATEPERPIEKLLRACARKRRDEAGAPFALHPATRRLLQGEVTRAFPRDRGATGGFSRLRAGLWPRFAWGFGLFAVLAIAAWVLVPSLSKDQKERQFAKNEPLSEALPARAPAPQPAAVAEAGPPQAAAPVNKALFDDADRAASRQATTSPSLRADQAALARRRTEAPAGDAKTTAPATPATGDSFKKAEAPRGGSFGGFSGTAADSSEKELAARRYPPADNLNAPAGVAAPPGSPAPAHSMARLAADKTITANEAQKEPTQRAAEPAPAYQPLVVTASPGALPAFADTAKDRSGSLALAYKDVNGVSRVQGFSSVALESKAKDRVVGEASTAQPVLASFRLEQTGSVLRIVDGDGSVYSGYLEIANARQRLRLGAADNTLAARALKAPKASPETDAAVAGLSGEQAGHNYFFRVVGTNRSLHKNVVFTGELTVATNVTLFTQTTNAWSIGGGGGGFQAGVAGRSPLPLLNARISGKAVIGDRKEIQIHAVPAVPSP